MPKLVLGIQGGPGSFNEEAANYYLQRQQITDYQIEYLFTSEAVLAALSTDQIDRGQFAIFNSAGGIVDETIIAMGNYLFKVVDKFAIKISHALMIHPAADFKDIDTIMTHPQVLLQCKTSLSEKYPHLAQTSGEGELIDSANVGKHLADGSLPKNIAVMGSKAIAQLYNLKVIEDNLQDLAENYTTFLQVTKK